MDWIVIDRVRAEDARCRRARWAAHEEIGGHERRDCMGIAEVLRDFAARDPRRHEAFMLVAVCEVPLDHAAMILGVCKRTVQRDVDFSKAWLADQIGHRTASDKT